jgi:hypothetical protein
VITSSLKGELNEARLGRGREEGEGEV